MDHYGEKIYQGRKKIADPSGQVKVVRTRRQQLKDSSGPDQSTKGGASNWLQGSVLSPEDIKQAQRADPVLAEVQDWLGKDQRPDFTEISSEGADLKFYWGQFASLKVVEGILMRELDLPDRTTKRQILVPPSLIKEILGHCHDAVTAGHLGQAKTLANVTRRFLWPGMRRATNLYIRSCDICASYKVDGRKKRAGLKDFRVGIPMERVCIDVVGPLPPSSRGGNKYALVVTDCFTKFVEMYAMPNQEAATVAEALTREFFSRYGVPHFLHSDQGTNFESRLFTEICKLLGIHKTRTTPFRPQSDGQSERNIKTLTKMIAMTAKEQTDWDEVIPFLTMAYRSTPQESTGMTPNFLMFGRELSLPVDVMIGPCPEPQLSTLEYVQKMQKRLEYAYKMAREQLKKSAERQGKLYDRRKTEDTYQLGDLVWYVSKIRKKGVAPKLQPKWRGPCVVVRQHSDVILEIQLSAKKTVTTHIDMLKKCYTTKRPRWMVKLLNKFKV